MKAPNAGNPDFLLWILDSAAILEGINVEARRCRTTPEVAAEVSQGGATGRRLENLVAAGLGVEPGSPAGRKRVQTMARDAGNLSRLSEADVSILGLALDHGAKAVLLSDDYTVLDIAQRLGLSARPVTKPGTTKTLDWTARCLGCGRTYGTELQGKPCPVCGSEIKLRPTARGRA